MCVLELHVECSELDALSQLCCNQSTNAAVSNFKSEAALQEIRSVGYDVIHSVKSRVSNFK